MSTSSKYHVLLIGIDAYAKQPLQGCVNDVLAFESVLRDRLGIPQDSICKLLAPVGSNQLAWTGDAPTHDNVLSTLRNLASGAVQPGDRVLIYYAGHGTRRRPWGGTVFAEAIIPIDAEGVASKLIYDYELGSLLHAIAAQSRDCTVILDCCCSGGTFRAIGNSDEAEVRPVGVRYYDWPQTDVQGGAAASTNSDSPHGLTSVTANASSWLSILAAAQADEAASEVGVGQPPIAHGALSYCLHRVLKTQPDDKLGGLLWAEIWTSLRREMLRLQLPQRPLLVGELSRPVFGGPAMEFDCGLPVALRSASEFEIEGGELAGVTAGTRLAVYHSSQPARFAALDSEDDRKDRLGEIMVERSAGGIAYAAAVGAFPSLSVRSGLRGRVIEEGTPVPLCIALGKDVAGWVRTLLESERCKRWVTLVKEETPEVSINTEDAGNEFSSLLLGDELYDSTSVRTALAKVSAGPEIPQTTRQRVLESKLISALRHMVRYVRPIRLAQTAQRLDSSLRPSVLRVSLLDMNDRPAVDSDDPDLIAAELEHSAERPVLSLAENGRYPVRSGQPLWLRVHNASTLNQKLFVTVLVCDSSGRVHVLNQPPLLLPQGCGEFVWPTGMAVGQALRFSSEWDEGLSSHHPDLALERVLVIATTAPVDLGFLAVDSSLQATIDGMIQSDKGDSAYPRIEWTAARLVLEVRNP